MFELDFFSMANVSSKLAVTKKVYKYMKDLSIMIFSVSAYPKILKKIQQKYLY